MRNPGFGPNEGPHDGTPVPQFLPLWRAWPAPRGYRDFPTKTPAGYLNEPAGRNPR